MLFREFKKKNIVHNFFFERVKSKESLIKKLNKVLYWLLKIFTAMGKREGVKLTDESEVGLKDKIHRRRIWPSGHLSSDVKVYTDP